PKTTYSASAIAGMVSCLDFYRAAGEGWPLRGFQRRGFKWYGGFVPPSSRRQWWLWQGRHRQHPQWGGGGEAQVTRLVLAGAVAAVALLSGPFVPSAAARDVTLRVRF